ncbi:nucleoside deaminase [Williamsia sp. 1135]|uniref:nucleoside deaminase n=1 Tax=Williamsia sp. 1135 TaxID=1889262 RepID=UPI000A0F7F7B|nr:nucleoside deaminase [Williamsia sp. 1135]ORM27761.1 tRNA-specific adenosine deaminase [Williamsia sp. 1135]
MTELDDALLLRRAVALAWSSRNAGNHPFGALLVTADGYVALEAQNTVVTGSDATGHAETNLVRLASSTFRRGELADMTLYTSTEPCAMCSGAVYWSGIGTVVYALAESALAELTGADEENPTMTLPCRDVFAAGQRPTIVRGPIHLPEAAAVHEGFWTS